MEVGAFSRAVLGNVVGFAYFCTRNNCVFVQINRLDMEIKRDMYLQRLVASRHNGMIKVVTGIRRCGKSYLLFKLFYDFLKGEGVDDSHIVRVDLEDRRNNALRDPDALLTYIDGRMTDGGMYYILLDEVQRVREFEDVLNSYLKVENADVYVTGSNSRFLSKDVITEFRGRGEEIRIHPLCFREFMSTREGGSQEEALREYMVYGGLPQTITLHGTRQKEVYLKHLFESVYAKDIKERYNIKHDADLEDLVNLLASSIGGLTNPLKLRSTFKSVKGSGISVDTIKNYLDILQDAFLLEKSLRYDIKGKRYIDTPSKYYFEDLYFGENGLIVGIKDIDSKNPDELAFMMMFDINGILPPNTWGKDIYGVDIKNGSIKPFGADLSMEKLQEDCSEKGTGLGCSYYYNIGGGFND